MNRVLLVFGNEYFEGDNLAVNVAKELDLDNIAVERCYSVDDLFNYYCYEKILVMDVVKGIDRVMLVEDINKIKEHKLYSLHDFDLGFFLKLMKRLGNLKELKIIGIPQKGDRNKIKEEVLEILKRI
jgi:Ni,Fe-hydrogenase maturation factor